MFLFLYGVFFVVSFLSTLKSKHQAKKVACIFSEQFQMNAEKSMLFYGTGVVIHYVNSKQTKKIKRRETTNSIKFRTIV